MKKLLSLFILIFAGFSFGQGGRDNSISKEEITDFIIIRTQKGDTPSKIALLYSVLFKDLEKYNNLKFNEVIETGTEIRIPITKEVSEALKKADKILGDSGIAFKQGLQYLKDNRRSQAGEDFNKSVEIFYRRNQCKLQCQTQRLLQPINRNSLSHRISIRPAITSNTHSFNNLWLEY